MRYSEIIHDFFGIDLSAADLRRVDAHFVAAAHHRLRAWGATDPVTESFHRGLFCRHAQAMFSIIRSGDFTRVFRAHDTVRALGLDRPKTWCLKFIPSSCEAMDAALPCSNIFEDMIYMDRRYGPGINTPNDLILDDPTVDPVLISVEEASA